MSRNKDRRRNKEQGTRNTDARASGGPRPWVLALAAIALAAVTFVLPGNTESASAHPLGNFSVNRLSIIEVAGNEVTGAADVRLTYLVDMAEIPTFQARGEIDPNGDGVLSAAEQRAYLDEVAPKLIGNLALEVAGSRVGFDIVSSGVELLEGQGGLNTARIALEATGVLPDGWQDGASASYEDRNYEGTNGWRQVIVRPGDGVDLFATSAPAEDVTKGLTAYPEDLLSSAPAVTSASFQLRAGETVAVPTQATAPATDTVARDEANKTLGRFASLVATENLTPAVIALALVLSAAWGAMHALGPGHGKTVVAAYLVGERGTGRHALYLGLIVTATHTISVFVLGAIAVFASDVIATDDIYFWLSLGSGLLVAVLGGALLFGRVRRLLRATPPSNPFPPSRASGRGAGGKTVHEHVGHAHTEHDAHVHTHGAHGHTHGHHEHGGHPEHEREHGHSHVPEQPGWRALVALGVAGGIVPCPTALVVMLGAIALDRAVFGLVMVTAFSAGLAGVLMGIGLLMVYGKRWLEGRRLPLVTSGMLRRAQLVAPVMSALAILGVGLVLTSQALL